MYDFCLETLITACFHPTTVNKSVCFDRVRIAVRAALLVLYTRSCAVEFEKLSHCCNYNQVWVMARWLSAVKTRTLLENLERDSLRLCALCMHTGNTSCHICTAYILSKVKHSLHEGECWMGHQDVLDYSNLKSFQPFYNDFYGTNSAIMVHTHVDTANFSHTNCKQKHSFLCLSRAGLLIIYIYINIGIY
jgi:hypothetical protein